MQMSQRPMMITMNHIDFMKFPPQNMDSSNNIFNELTGSACGAGQNANVQTAVAVLSS